MYKKGQEDALESFGLMNKTDKPPPTWAHGRKVTIPSMTQATCKHSCRKCAGKERCSCE